MTAPHATIMGIIPRTQTLVSTTKSDASTHARLRGTIAPFSNTGERWLECRHGSNDSDVSSDGRELEDSKGRPKVAKLYRGS